MDSMIREIQQLRKNAENDSPEYDYGYDAAIDAVVALLTAEPEPSNCPLYAATCSGHYDECPHADELRKEPSEDYEAWLKTQADGPWNTNKDDSGNYTDYSTALVFRGFVAAQQSASHRLQQEQAAHEQIASICFAAGVETPDGTSIGAVRNLARRLQEMQNDLYMAEKKNESLTAIIESHERAGDNIRLEVERLRKALTGVKEALNDAELNMGNYDSDDVRHLNVGAIDAWTIPLHQSR